MRESIQKTAPLVGRILISLIFVSAGWNKITNWEGTAGYMTAYGMPLVPLFLIAAMATEILGSLSVLLGIWARWGALALFLFMIPTTIIFHNFWSVPDAERMMQMMNFMKNLAIMGGLLVIVGLGSGPLSFDHRRQKNSPPSR
jgi:putative oxidoreductase